MRFIIFALGGALALAGCGGSPRIESSSSLSVVRDDVLPAPTRTDLVAPDRETLIGPLDTLGIDVTGVPELTRTVHVDASGRIALPLRVGVLDVRGRTAPEVAEAIRERLLGLVKNPEVIVNISAAVSQVVTVDGSVKQPGLYPVTNQTTLVQAIASAQGLTEFGKDEDVVILRKVNNQRMAGLYNLAAIRRGVYVDPPIYANDLVIVGDSTQRRMFRDLLAATPLITAPLILLLQ